MNIIKAKDIKRLIFFFYAKNVNVIFLYIIFSILHDILNIDNIGVRYMKKLGMFIILFVFCFAVNIVKAETITLEQVTNKVKELLTKENASELNFTIETTANSITFKDNDDFSLKFDYENDILSTKYTLISLSNKYETMEEYIELTKKDKKNDEAIGLIIYALVELHGYTERDWRLFNNFDYDATLEVDSYEYKPLSATEMTFKTYINKFNLNLNYVDAVAPKMNVYEVTKNSIWVYPSADVSDGTIIEIYLSEDGVNFEYYGSSTIRSGKSSSRIGFEELESGKTMYFKTVVEKSRNFSDVLKATTLSENEENNNSNNNKPNDEIDNSTNNDSTIDNPKTGIFNPMLICSIFSISGIFLISALNKKNKIKKI